MRRVIAVVLAASLTFGPGLVQAQTSPGLAPGKTGTAVVEKAPPAPRGPSALEHRLAFGLVGGVLGHLFTQQGLRSYGAIAATAPAGGQAMASMVAPAAAAGGGLSLAELITLSTTMSVVGVAVGALAGYLAGRALYPDEYDVSGQE